MRPWIAMACAYVLVLHAVIGGLLGARAGATTSLPAADAIIVCLAGHDASGGDPDKSGKKPVDHWACALCAFAQAPQAILSDHQATARLHAGTRVTRAAPKAGQVLQYDSPTGQYPRGPPRSALVVG
jgi:hypothetical protein